VLLFSNNYTFLNVHNVRKTIIFLPLPSFYSMYFYTSTLINTLTLQYRQDREHRNTANTANTGNTASTATPQAPQTQQYRKHRNTTAPLILLYHYSSYICYIANILCNWLVILSSPISCFSEFAALLNLLLLWICCLSEFAAKSNSPLTRYYEFGLLFSAICFWHDLSKISE
jgi:hypothetical protein